MAIITPPGIEICLSEGEPHGHILWCHAQPLFEVGDSTFHTATKESWQLAIQLTEGEIGPPILVARLQAQSSFHLCPHVLDHLERLDHALYFAQATIIRPEPKMPFHTGRLEGYSALTHGNATREIVPFLTRLSVIADMVVYSRRTPEQLVFVNPRLQSAFDDAASLAVARHVLTV